MFVHLETSENAYSATERLHNVYSGATFFASIHPPLLSSRFSNNNANMDASVFYKEEWASKNSFEHKVCLYFDANFPWGWKFSNFVFHCLLLFLEIWNQVSPVWSKLIWFWNLKNMEKIWDIIYMFISQNMLNLKRF